MSGSLKKKRITLQSQEKCETIGTKYLTLRCHKQRISILPEELLMFQKDFATVTFWFILKSVPESPESQSGVRKISLCLRGRRSSYPWEKHGPAADPAHWHLRQLRIQYKHLCNTPVNTNAQYSVLQVINFKRISIEIFSLCDSFHCALKISQA